MDAISFWLSLAAAVFSGAGLLVMRHQLVVAREVAGGRGLVLRAQPSGIVTVVNGVAQPRSVSFGVEAVGPGKWADLAGWLMHEDGSMLEQLWKPEARFSNEHERIRVTRDLDVDLLRQVYLLVTWIEPKNDGIRSMAVRTRPLPKAGGPQPAEVRGVRRLAQRQAQKEPRENVVEEFRWHRTQRMRHWYQSTKRPLFPGSGTPRALGKWRAMPDANYDATQLPGFPFSD